MRAVLDANIFVSSLLTREGNSKQIMDFFESGAFDLLISDPILSEIERVLSYPRILKVHKKSSAEIEQYVAALRSSAELVAPTETLTVSSDESDNRYIECAIAGNASYVVTGDKKHLLPISEYKGVQILSPASFLAFLMMEKK